MEDYGYDIIPLIDEDGNETNFEHLDTIKNEEGTYVALIPLKQDPNDYIEDSGELVILKAVDDENGDQALVSIDDEDEYDRVAAAFEKRLEDEFDFEDEE